MSTRTATTRRIRRTIAAVAGGLAALAATATTAAAEDDYFWATNTIQTPTGAYLQSDGVCGYGTFEFTVTSYGFEYLQLGVLYPGQAEVIWSDFLPLAPVFEETTPVVPFANNVYFVRGWDWNGTGWTWADVTTDFFYPHNGMYLDGC